MPFTKGDNRINRKGRPKDSKNKSAEEFRELISEFLSDNWDKLQIAFDAMKDNEKALFIDRLLKYKVPEALNPDRLSLEQLEQVYYFIKKRHDEQERDKIGNI